MTMTAIDGVSLFTRSAGSGPATVVLHGGPGASHDYLLPQYDLLARGRTLLYYDQRGGGRSPIERSTPAGWREHVADLEGLRVHWGLERLTLLGYSWGGLLALLYALEHPALVERLALVCPAPATARWREQFEGRLAERMADRRIAAWREELRRSGLQTADPERYRREAFAISVAGYFRDPRSASALTPFRVTARSQQAVWESLGDYDLRERLGSTFRNAVPPVLVVYGTYDPIPPEATRELAGLIHAELRELPTGHAPHVEATDELFRTLDAFLPKS